jgi:probable rRNA maturation factor
VPKAAQKRPGAAQRPGLALTIQEVASDPALPIDRPRLRRWVRAALEHEASLVFRFVDEAEGRHLNHAYRERDRPTNVLTFAYAGAPRVEADIVICIPVVLAESKAARIAARDHLAHLVIHGTLHAQGYDHEDDGDARRMEAREVAILHRFGIADPYERQ